MHGFDDYLIDVGLNVDTNLFLETLLHHPLIRCCDIHEPEVHSYIEEGPKGCDEGGILLVGLLHAYLMVARVSVQKTQALAISGGIYHLGDVRHKGRVIPACVVDVIVVNTHAPGHIFSLVCHDGISEPLWMCYFSNETESQESGDLLTNGSSSS